MSPVMGLESKYLISPDGKIFSITRNRYIKSFTNRFGYEMVYLYPQNGEKRKAIFLHKLLAINFISNPKNLPVVDHIDGDKSNNSLENLEWVTSRENQLRAINIGLKRVFRGTEQGNAKLDEKQILYIRSSNKKQRDLAKELGVAQSTIWAAKNRRTWVHV